MTIRMYHPALGVEIEARDDRQAAVYAESGWKPAPEPEVRPGYQPDPVRYEPVTEPSGAKPRRRGPKINPASAGEDPDHTDHKES